MKLNKYVLALVVGMLLVEPACAKSSFKGFLKSLSNGKQKQETTESQTTADSPAPTNSQAKTAAQAENTFVDSRDGTTYKFVKIGDLVWMAQNLNYGDTIAAPGLIGNSWCYDNDKRNCAQYGRLYSWSAAMDSAGNVSKNAKGCGKGKKCTPTYPVRGVCPEGWHFPELAEWQNLADAVGRKKDALLANIYYGAKDEYGFAGLAAGNRRFNGSDTVFWGLASNGHFWTSTEYNETEAIEWGLGDNRWSYGEPGYGKSAGYSVRCVKDDSLAAANVVFHDPRNAKAYKVANIGGVVWFAHNLDFKTKESWCYANGEENCVRFGRLYSWKAAQNACPSGWRLPTDSEWPTIMDNVERLGVEAFGNRDAKGKYGWPIRAEFWTSGATGSKGKFYFYDLSTKTGKFDTFNKKGAKSVRCVKK